MAQTVGYVALVVRDYDEAIAYYTGILGFRLMEDTDLGAGRERLVNEHRHHGRLWQLLP